MFGKILGEGSPKERKEIPEPNPVQENFRKVIKQAKSAEKKRRVEENLPEEVKKALERYRKRARTLAEENEVPYTTALIKTAEAVFNTTRLDPTHEYEFGKREELVRQALEQEARDQAQTEEEAIQIDQAIKEMHEKVGLEDPFEGKKEE
jgi:transposase